MTNFHHSTIEQQIYARFCQEFPNLKDMVVKFFSTRSNDGGRAIRIYLNTGKWLKFTLYEKGTWALTMGDK